MIFLYSFYISLINIFWHVCKTINLFKKKEYIKENKYFTMNLKERGVTVGDLLIIFIIILSTTILVKSLNKDKKTAFNNSNHEYLDYQKTSLSQFKLRNFSAQ